MSVGIVGLDVSDGWRVTQGREIRCEDKKLLRECLASGLRLTHWWVAWITSQKRRDCRTPRALEGTEECVEFVGGGEDFAIGEDDVAPGGVGAAGEAQGIAQAGAGYGDG